MKKLQCEVCGSTSIKKISDGVFECQDCGIQYSDEEVKKLLTEVKGNTKTDTEQNSITGTKNNNMGENRKYADFYVIEPNVDPQKNVRDFLEQLSLCDCIACDVYKEIEITDVREVYYPFYFLKRSGTYIWNAVSIKHRFEKETVYKERYNTTTRRNESFPVTRDVYKEHRTPVNGSYDAYGSNFFAASDDLINSCKDDDKESLNALISEFLDQQKDKYDGKNAIPVDPNKISISDGIVTYNGMLLNDNLNVSKVINAESALRDEVHDAALKRICDGIPGDGYEGFSYSVTNKRSTEAKILIPVQIIEYRYKGKIYTAISDLLERTATMPCTYPCDTALKEKRSSLIEEAKKTGAFVIYLILGLISIIAAFVVLYFANDSGSTDGIFLGVLLTLAAFVIWIIGGIVNKMKNTEHKKRAVTVKNEAYLPKKEALERTKKVFMEQYTDAASAGSAASEESCPEVSDVRTEVSSAMDPSKVSNYFENLN